MRTGRTGPCAVPVNKAAMTPAIKRLEHVRVSILAGTRPSVKVSDTVR